MELHRDTQQFIEDLRNFSAGRLHFPQDVANLIDLTRKENMAQVFRDAIFQAKFAVKTRDIMGRIGRDGEGFDKLSVEFQNSVEKTSTLLKTIVKEAPADVKQHFVNDFFTLDQASFANFGRLLEDLGWVKNWEVDGKPLPLGAVHPPERTAGDTVRESLGRIVKSSVLALLLMVLFVIADPPVTYLGWGIAGVVMLLLLFVALTSLTIKKS